MWPIISSKILLPVRFYTTTSNQQTLSRSQERKNQQSSKKKKKREEPALHEEIITEGSKRALRCASEQNFHSIHDKGYFLRL
jgi:hypothetical protein